MQQIQGVIYFFLEWLVLRMFLLNQIKPGLNQTKFECVSVWLNCKLVVGLKLSAVSNLFSTFYASEHSLLIFFLFLSKSLIMNKKPKRPVIFVEHSFWTSSSFFIKFWTFKLLDLNHLSFSELALVGLTSQSFHIFLVHL